MTREDAIKAAATGEWMHYTGNGPCTRTVGPRGGVKERVTQVRPSGQCKLWKRDPELFRLPVKYGLYEHGAVEPYNAADFHLASDCPLNQEDSHE